MRPGNSTEPDMSTETTERLREHPDTRLADSQVAVDFEAVAARLRAEPSAGEGGHRQQVVYRHGPVTIALFTFDRFTHLPEHAARGVVSMQVLRGRLKITAEGRVYQMGPGQMLTLAPEVRHAVAAEEESDLLVTICLTK